LGPAPEEAKWFGSIGEAGNCDASNVFAFPLKLEGVIDAAYDDLGLVQLFATLLKFPNDDETEILLWLPSDSSRPDGWLRLKGLKNFRFSRFSVSVNPLPRLVRVGFCGGTARVGD
jgi:hypothetical protein